MGKLDYSIIGKRFGRLTVLDFDHINKHGASNWRCKCDCGNETVVTWQSLIKGRTKSCGCYHRDTRHIRRSEELTGKRFGRLYVVDYDHTDNHGKTYWLCECNCGNKVVVTRNSLITGRTVSCGCRRRTINLTHGMCTTRLYSIWDGMRRRCENPSHHAYNLYGGRGITVCNEWLTFEGFRDWALENGYSDDLTIDRINNDGDYCPENCRWVDYSTQGNNRRTCRYITYNGITHTIAEWARLFGVGHSTLTYRLKHNNMQDFENYFEDGRGG